LDFLDAFGDLMPARAKMTAAHSALATARERCRALDRLEQDSRQRQDLLEFQVQELNAANVQSDEEDTLRREREVLRHAERLYGTSRAGEETLYSGENATLDAVTRLTNQLSELRRIDPLLDAPAELLESARVQLEEAALQLRAYAEHVQVDPARLEEIETRLELLARLSRKYGVASAELPAALASLSDELASQARQTEDRAEARRAVERLELGALEVAAELSKARAKITRRVQEEMGRELSILGMQGARLEILQEAPAELERASRLGKTGFDTIEFYLSANPGEEAKPLTRVASGGELSRVMLALKALTVSDETPILIFDEVDAGIGGAVADAVARRLKALAKTRQLLCITHLPQIAAYADHHFAVEKQRSRGRTITQARALAADERVLELSRMLGGVVAPAEAERYAKKLVAQAQEGRLTR
jgi:DNA repair protein RecN (Recombination protein N)